MKMRPGNKRRSLRRLAFSQISANVQGLDARSCTIANATRRQASMTGSPLPPAAPGSSAIVFATVGKCRRSSMLKTCRTSC